MPAPGIKRYLGQWRLVLVVFCAMTSAFSCLAYFANSIVVGALIGLPGREPDIAHAQRVAEVSIAMAALAQLGVVLLISSLLTIGAESPRIPRLIARTCVAFLLSIPVVLGASLLLVVVIKYLH